MARSKPILIGCPQYRRLVRGWYACGPDGQYRPRPDGTFDLGRARCDEMHGRCMATLCALHRFNRAGPGTWYPERILALPAPADAPKNAEGPPPHDATVFIQA